jgi:cytochrome c biogenesis factor
LGWGGWWFWDPVENASLMPWLLATASIHSVKGTLLFKQKRTLHFSKPIFEMGSNQNPENQLLLWTLFLSIWTFLFSILGTFFVRSGVLTSVHSFATDSTRGLCLLFFFGWMCFVSHFFLTLLKTIIFKANFFFPFFGFIVLAKGLPFCMPKRFGAGFN